MKKILAFCLAAAMVLGGCGNGSENTTEETAQADGLTVVTSFYPVYLLAANVTDGVEGVTLKNMTQPQTGCLHDYELTTEDMKTLEGADVLLINGLGMESFLDKVMGQYPDLFIVDTSTGSVTLAGDDHGHAHEGEEETDEEEVNAHIWLNPSNGVKQAEVICDALSQADPANADKYAANTATFAESMKSVIAQADSLKAAAGTEVGVFHEGFGYLADLCGMEIGVDIYADENEEPSAKEMADAAEEIKEDGIKLLLAADDAGMKYAETLAAETGATVVELNPITSGELNKDVYRLGMERNLQTLADALS